MSRTLGPGIMGAEVIGDHVYEAEVESDFMSSSVSFVLRTTLLPDPEIPSFRKTYKDWSKALGYWRGKYALLSVIFAVYKT